MSLTRTFEIANLEATEAFGRKLGRALFPGAVIALVGPLGAGKTHLSRAIAEGLEITDSNLVSSPTFVLIQEYPARLPIYHFDAYRLRNSQEFEDLGSNEYLHGDGVCLIEWADRVPDAMPGEHLQIAIQIVDQNRRQFQVEALGERYTQLLEQLAPESA